jgi:hypothetical protein
VEQVLNSVDAPKAVSESREDSDTDVMSEEEVMRHYKRCIESNADSEPKNKQIKQAFDIL